MKKDKIYGPFARQRKDGTWEINEEGQAFLAEWLKSWPDPAKLLNTAHRSTFSAYMAQNAWQEADGVRYEAINQSCRVAICNSILTYQPTMCVFTTYAAYAMRCEVQREMHREGKAYRKGVVSGDTTYGDDDADLFDNIGDQRLQRDTVESDDGFEYMIRMIRNKRHRSILRRRFRDGISDAEIAKEEQVTRTHICNIIKMATTLIRKNLEECAV